MIALYQQSVHGQNIVRVEVAQFLTYDKAAADFGRDGTKLLYSPDYVYVVVDSNGAEWYYSYFDAKLEAIQ